MGSCSSSSSPPNTTSNNNNNINNNSNDNSTTKNLKYELYAMPVGQPSRAIIWLAALTGFEYELKITMPRVGTLTDEFLDNVNPFGTIPALVIRDARTGEKLSALLDSIAIASYICDVTGDKGEALFPKKDPVLRAKVIQLALFGTVINRSVTNDLFLPLFRAFNEKQSVGPLTRKDVDEFVSPKFEGQVVDLFRAQGSLKLGRDGAKDAEVAQALAASPFLIPEAGRVTFADIANCVETYQVELFDLADQLYARRPCFKRWTEAMKQVPHFDEVHEMAIGFIRTNLLPLLPQK